MSILTIIGYLYFDPIWIIWILWAGFMLTLVIIFLVKLARMIKKYNKKSFPKPNDLDDEEKIIYETDVLGLEKQYNVDRESYTTIKNVIDWRIVLLVVLVFIAFYMILHDTYSSKDVIQGVNSTSIEEKKE